MKNIILASASPRRLEIFNNHGIRPVVHAADVTENIPLISNEVNLPSYLSLKKALAVYDDYRDQPNTLIVASDTVVIDPRNNILGKPQDKTQAYDMISCLSGKTHSVISSAAVIDTDTNIKYVFYDITYVDVCSLTSQQISAYINTDEPYDKAGGYAIQGIFGNYISGYKGSYLNVMGFPWEKYSELILKNKLW